jgi:AcrR family transcriptional regulator
LSIILKYQGVGVGRGKKIVDIELVVEEAIALIEEGGVEEFSTRRLASRLGISAMTLYNYYENRGAILKGALRKGLAIIWDGLEAEIGEWHARGGSAIGAYRVLADHLLDFSIARPNLCSFVLTESAGNDWRAFDADVDRMCRGNGDAALPERSPEMCRAVYLFELLVFALALKVIGGGETADGFRLLMTEGYERLLSGYEKAAG